MTTNDDPLVHVLSRRLPGAAPTLVTRGDENQYGLWQWRWGDVLVAAQPSLSPTYWRAENVVTGQVLYSGYNLERLVAVLKGQAPPSSTTLASAVDWEGRLNPALAIRPEPVEDEGSDSSDTDTS
jgi:hypothetical protein